MPEKTCLAFFRRGLSIFKSRKREKGFSMIEVLVAITLMGVALLGLAQLFTYSVLTNSRTGKMSNAVFLAQQKIEWIRNLTMQELSTQSASIEDEQMDINSDGTIDFRRLTSLETSGFNWKVRVLVFSAENLGATADAMIQNPINYRVKADISTLVSR